MSRPSRVAGVLRRLWAPPAVGHPSDLSRVVIAHRVALIILLGDAIVVAFAVASPGASVLATFVVHTPLLALAATSLWLVRTGHVTAAGWLLSLCLWAFVSAVVWFFGGLLANNAIAYVLAVMVAGTTIGLRASLAIAGLSISFASVAVYAERAGLLPTPVTPLTSINAWIALAATVALTSLLHDIAVLARDRAIQQAERNLAELRRAQAENEIRIEHGRTIGHLGQRALRSMEPQSFCLEALDALVAVLGEPLRAAVLLPKQGRMEVYAMRGGLDGPLPPVPDETAAFGAASDGTVATASAQALPALAAVLRASPYSNLLAVPLGGPGHDVGSVVAVAPDRPLDAEQRLFFTTVCGLVGSVLQRDRAESRLLHAQKLEVVGRLAGGVAHDFNNILTVVLSVASGLREPLTEAERNKLLDALDSSADRAVLVTRQLLAFTRRNVEQTQPLRVDEVLAGIDPLLRRLLRDDVRLVVHPGAPGAKALVDRGNLEQVLLNLVVNARDAMPQGGLIEIRTARVDEAIELRVRDDGIGMDAATRDAVFQPFFSTRPDGTGLGLAIVDDIVRRHGGSITLESAPGLGTTFRILLPLAVESGFGAPTPVPSTRGLPRLPGRILLAEDNALVRQNVARMLEGAGHLVVAVGDGTEALELLTRDARFDLLLTDLSMPGMGGLALSRAIAARGLDLPVLVMTGYADALPEELGAGHFLQKPFTLQSLLEAIDARRQAGRPKSGEARDPSSPAVG